MKATALASRLVLKGGLLASSQEPPRSKARPPNPVQCFNINIFTPKSPMSATTPAQTVDTETRQRNALVKSRKSKYFKQINKYALFIFFLDQFFNITMPVLDSRPRSGRGQACAGMTRELQRQEKRADTGVRHYRY